RHSGVASGAIARAIAAAIVPALARRDDEHANTRRRVKAGEAGTYIADILAERDSSLARWPDRQGMPLTVWIQPDADIPGFNNKYVASVREAFEEWDRLHLPVHFAFVADSADAEVHVAWIDHFTQPISGRTRW